MFFFSTEKWSIKYGSYCIVATAQMKFASEARPSQYIGPFGNTEPTCMPLSGHFMDIEGRSGPSVPDGEIPTQSNL